MSEYTGIMPATQKRISSRVTSKRIREVQRANRDARKRYRGGTIAEIDSQRILHQQCRLEVRRTWLSRQGRKIDLISLLTQRREDGSPLWAIADPMMKLGGEKRWSGTDTRNGMIECSSSAQTATYWVAAKSHQRSRWGSGYDLAASITVPMHDVNHDYTADAIPALPARVRALFGDKKIRDRAKFVALLYQPSEWRLPKPDPAVVVEWWDRPGEYFALAVWGVDGPAIMEFVD